jgi:polyisoprenoid-binding protein YceI
MTSRRISSIQNILFAAAITALLIASAQSTVAQAPPAPAAKPPAPTTPSQLEAQPGTKASYRVKEQLAGLSFPDDAVGTTDQVTGTVVILPNGTVDTAKSKLTIGLQSLKSDQDMRDGYVKGRTLEADKFPNAEFVPRTITGLPNPLPAADRATDQTEFKLTGDLTIHGVTKPVTLTGYATMSKDMVAGAAHTDFTFATFNLTKPTLARLLSVDDKIDLELQFKFKRTN